MGNQYIVWAQRAAIIMFYLYQIYRFNIAKRYDKTIRFKIKGIGLLEFGGLVIINAVFFFYPVDDSTSSVMMIVGLILILATFFQLRRIVACGRKVLYAVEHAFDLRQIQKTTLERNILTFYIKSSSVRVRFPIGDMDAIMESLSGKRKVKRGK